MVEYLERDDPGNRQGYNPIIKEEEASPFKMGSSFDIEWKRNRKLEKLSEHGVHKFHRLEYRKDVIYCKNCNKVVQE